MGTLAAVDFKSDGTLFIKLRGCDFAFLLMTAICHIRVCVTLERRVCRRQPKITKDCVFVLEGTQLNCAVLLRLIKTIKASTYWSYWLFYIIRVSHIQCPSKIFLLTSQQTNTDRFGQSSSVCTAENTCEDDWYYHPASGIVPTCTTCRDEQTHLATVSYFW